MPAVTAPKGQESIDLLLPCRNELQALMWLLPRIPKEINVTLCDNGSTDGSVEYAKRNGAEVVSEPKPRRVGAAIAAGIDATHGSIVCVIDCDGSVDPHDIPSLIAPITNNTADFSVGRRMRSPHAGQAWLRFASWARDLLVRACLKGWPLSDLGSARAFRRDAISPLSRPLNRRFAWNLDATAEAFQTIGPERIAAVRLAHHDRIGRSQIAGHAVGSLIAAIDTLAVIWKRRDCDAFSSSQDAGITR